LRIEDGVQIESFHPKCSSIPSDVAARAQLFHYIQYSNADDNDEEDSSKIKTDIDEIVSIGDSISFGRSDIEAGSAEKETSHSDTQNGLRDRLRKWRPRENVMKTDNMEAKEGSGALGSEDKTSATEEKGEDTVITNHGGTNIFTCQAETCVVS